MKKNIFKSTLFSVFVFWCSLCTLLPLGMAQEQEAEGPQGPNWRQVFQNIWAHNILQTDPSSAPLSLLHRYVYYNPQDFNLTAQKIASAPNSLQSALQTEMLLSNDQHLKSLLVSPKKWQSYFSSPAAQKFLSSFQVKKTAVQGNFFHTSQGQFILQELKDYMVVILSGYGAHTTDEYAYSEMIKEINLYYGRKAQRPFVQVGPQKEYQSLKEFYKNPPSALDILHPIAKELGNSLGDDAIQAQAIAGWFKSLPSHYASKKIIFVGYSKGANVALELLRIYPSLQKRTSAVISVAGSLQGSVTIEAVAHELGIKKIGDQKAWQELEKAKQLLALVAETNIDQALPLFQSLLQQFSSAFHLPYVDLLPLVSLAQNTPWGNLLLEMWNYLQLNKDLLLSTDIPAVGKGVEGLSVRGKTQWNLKYLSDDSYKAPLKIWNLSVLTQLHDILLPGPVADDRQLPLPHPSVIPQLNEKGQIAWPQFSMDNFILHLTALYGFANSDGGLMDMQVHWHDSKMPILDARPLNQSLTAEQLEQLSHDEGVNSLLSEYGLSHQDLQQMPRQEIFKLLPHQHLQVKDLGEVRAHHWSVAFEQIFRPQIFGQKTTSFQHNFPRKALLASMLEVLALEHSQEQSLREQAK